MTAHSFMVPYPVPGVAPGMLGYDRALEWKEPPSPDEIAACGWSVVRAAGTPAGGWLPLASIGSVHLYLAAPGAAAEADRLYDEPLVAAKRGAPARGGYVGVDGRIRRTDAYTPRAPERSPAGAGARPRPMARAGDGRRPDAPTAPAEIRVAVIDVSFDCAHLLAPFGPERVDGPYAVGLQGAAPAAPPSPTAGHGTAMAGIVLHEVAGVRVGLFQIPSVAGAVRAYMGATDVAVAIARAVGAWQADVVVVAMSEGSWGTPRHLRDVLREAARTGRGGRGAAIFCSVGDPAKNHSCADDSAALGADDLASQPWVLAVAPCDGEGRWQRANLGYHAPGAPGAVYGRLGPAVALAAQGSARRFGQSIAADDSSQAAALAAAAGARALQASPALTLDELRAILTLTADVPPAVDAGRGLAAGIFDGWDRSGHNFKLGYGCVNGGAAALAAADPLALAVLSARSCPDPAPSSGRRSTAQIIAEAWQETLDEASDQTLRGSADGAAAGAADGGGDLARRYLRVRATLARAALGSLPAREALAWLGRHLGAIADEGEHGAWFQPDQDHGALADRFRHAAAVLRDALTDDHRADDARTWLDDFDDALAPERAAACLADLTATVLRRALARSPLPEARRA